MLINSRAFPYTVQLNLSFYIICCLLFLRPINFWGYKPFTPICLAQHFCKMRKILDVCKRFSRAFGHREGHWTTVRCRLPSECRGWPLCLSPRWPEWEAVVSLCLAMLYLGRCHSDAMLMPYSRVWHLLANTLPTPCQQHGKMQDKRLRADCKVCTQRCFVSVVYECFVK